ncbi:glycosyltransferase [Plantibacter sp. YIM 135347]|uniref:glycosyltransferase n=1 Tax=Plantibacter sp. YIM 135347 TaxID=3423919 RepID=UPI003D356CD1
MTQTDLPRRIDGLPTVTVVIPAFNEERIIARCLTALTTAPDPADEIIVVDNGSSDATAQIAARFPGVRVVTEPRSGVTYARTAGFDEAGGEIIARIDADTIVTSCWMRRIRSIFHRRAALDAIGGGATIAELSPGRLLWCGWWYRGFRWWHERSIGVRPMVYGFNGAMRRSAWRSARRLIAMGDHEVSEDVDLTIALLRTGHRIVFVPRLLVKARLFRSIDREKLARYYRTDSLTLTRHGHGNPRRWVRRDER